MTGKRRAKPQVKVRTPDPAPSAATIARRVRVTEGRLSNYELAPLIGVHHDDLTGDLDPHRNTVAALIALSRHTDLHPADLVADLDPLMRLRRLEPEPGVDDPNELDAVERDAATLLSALTLARGPVSVGTLAAVLGWTLERAASALDVIIDNPHLGGPLALRRAPNGAYTLTPRLDLLSYVQRRDLDEALDADAFTFTAAHTALLLMLMSAHGVPKADLLLKFRAEHADLVALGVLRHPNPDDPGCIEIDPDVCYSLADPGTD